MLLPSGYSFQVSVEREVDALRFFYRFLTCDWLFAPECSAFSDSAGQPTKKPTPLLGPKPTTFTGDSVGSERAFIAQMISRSPGAIHCVAAFDEKDTQRVSAYYMSGSYTVNVVFARGWKPTDDAVLMISSLFDVSLP